MEYKTSKMLTSTRMKKAMPNKKADHEKMEKLLKTFKNKVIKHIRYELKFIENGVFYFDTPILDSNKRYIKSISQLYAFYPSFTELRLEQLSAETLIELLATIEN